jgi:hypothetical protein
MIVEQDTDLLLPAQLNFLKSLQAGENASDGKWRRAAAVQDLSDISTVHCCARSVLECASPLALSAREKINSEDKGMTEF